MMTEVNFFPQSNYISRRLGSGVQGRVYAISPQHVAKVLKRDRSPHGKEESLEIELENLTALYNAGISVPKPEGIYKVRIRWFETAFGLLFPEKEALVMERIYGTRIESTAGRKLQSRVYTLYFRELKKAFHSGFISDDHIVVGPSGKVYRNAIYDPKRDKIFLTDLMNFRRV